MQCFLKFVRKGEIPGGCREVQYSNAKAVLCFTGAPRFTVQQGKMRRNLLAVPVGNSAKLDCSADGNPRPTVKWYKDGNLFKERKSGNKLYWSRWATILILTNLVPYDSGSYMCNVSNSYGWINHTYKLDVHGKTKDPPNFSG